MTYGATYCSILDATLPPTGFSMFEKWSLDSIEWVGSVLLGLFHGSNCCLALHRH